MSNDHDKPMPPPESCPQPLWHETHHYCPCCSFVSDEAKMRELTNRAVADIPIRQQEIIERQAAEITRLTEERNLLLQACEAEAAWHDAEDESPKTTLFEDRMDLCSYSEWAVKRALGRDVPDRYQPLPRLVLKLREYSERNNQTDCEPPYLLGGINDVLPPDMVEDDSP